MTITKDDVLGVAEQLKAVQSKALEMGIYDLDILGNCCYMASKLFNEHFARGARLLVADTEGEFPVMATSEAGGIEFRTIYRLEEAKKAWGNSRIENLLNKGAE